MAGDRNNGLDASHSPRRLTAQRGLTAHSEVCIAKQG